MNNESVSFCIRQDRFSKNIEIYQILIVINLLIFLKEQVAFIFNAIQYFKKTSSPSFYLWSNDFNNLQEIFKNEKIILIDNSDISDNLEKMILIYF